MSEEIRQVPHLSSEQWCEHFESLNELMENELAASKARECLRHKTCEQFFKERKEMLSAQEKIKELESEINSLRQAKTLAQEGWTKALEENRELVGALEKIADYNFPFASSVPEDQMQDIAKEALKQHREERKR